MILISIEYIYLKYNILTFCDIYISERIDKIMRKNYVI